MPALRSDPGGGLFVFESNWKTAKCDMNGAKCDIWDTKSDMNGVRCDILLVECDITAAQHNN